MLKSQPDASGPPDSIQLCIYKYKPFPRIFKPESTDFAQDLRAYLKTALPQPLKGLCSPKNRGALTTIRSSHKSATGFQKTGPGPAALRIYTDMEYSSEYLPGVIPSTFLNIRINELALAYPTSFETFWTLCPCRISSFAF